MNKRWLLPDPAPTLAGSESLIGWVSQSLQRAGLLLPPDPRPLARLVSQLLFNRGIPLEHATAYFEASERGDSPFRLKGMNDAITRLRRALKQREKIAIYGDYDVDGVSATALLVTTLQAFGADVVAYIPHRVDDGYGLNNESLNQLKSQGVQLVVSVDCGVRAIPEAAYARSIDLDLIITDHHTPHDHLPDAIVINPRQVGCAYPFKELAGVGVAFKLAQALLLTESKAPVATTPLALAPEALLDFVALGTVADIVPLRGENRYLARRGLATLNATPRVGMRELVMKAGVKLGQVDAGTIGFALGPRLNAAGRLDHAKLSYELLTTQDRVYAEHLATKLDEINRARQDKTKECASHARDQMLATQPDASVVFAADPAYPQGVVGLIAGRLVEEFYRPALAIEQGAELSKGSARTIPEFNIIEALDQCADVLLKYGGHKAAAGFTLQTSKLDELRQRLNEIARKQFDGQVLTPSVRVDAEVSFSELDQPLLYLLAQMEPYGAENPSPLFMARNVGVRAHRIIGKDGEHLRMGLVQNRVTREAVAFRQGKQWQGKLPPLVDLVFSFEWNEYNGAKTMQLNVKDIKASHNK